MYQKQRPVSIYILILFCLIGIISIHACSKEQKQSKKHEPSNGKIANLNIQEIKIAAPHSSDLLGAALITEAMLGFHLGFENASDAKKNAERYFEVLLTLKPESIGGKLPNQGFYYEK